MITHIHSLDEYLEFVKEHNCVFIKATASWCGPCKQIAPFFKGLSDNPAYDWIAFGEFDVDECEEVSKELNVTAMPTFTIIKDGKIMGVCRGASPDKILDLLNYHLHST